MSWDEIRTCAFMELENVHEQSNKPKFVFAHINLPHHPYSYDSTGKLIEYSEIDEELDEKELTANKKSKTNNKTRIKTSYKENHYYIIAGAFAEQKNVQKMVAKLKKGNYNAEIVEGGSLMRVSYNSFTNKEDAILALKGIKNENPSAWLLTK